MPSRGEGEGGGECHFIKICQNTPQLCWGDEWPTLSPGGRGLGRGGNDLIITPTLILPHQGGGKFFRELDAPQLCCGVLHLVRLY